MFSGALLSAVVSGDSVINPIVLLYFLLSDICYVLLFVILSSTEKTKAKRIVCGSPSLFILNVLCVVVSISGRLYFCIFSCDPLLFLSGVLCPSPQAIGALLFLYAVWWDGQKLIRFLCSGSHMMEYCLLCCVFSGAVLCCLCCLRWKCVKYQDIGETYPGWFTFL